MSEIQPNYDDKGRPWCAGSNCQRSMRSCFPTRHGGSDDLECFATLEELKNTVEPVGCPIAISRMAKLSERRADELRRSFVREVVLLRAAARDTRMLEIVQSSAMLMRLKWTDLDLGPLPAELDGE